MDLYLGLLSHAFSHQVTQFGLAFTVAAWLHGGRVKREIRLMGGEIGGAFNNLAEALKNDLKNLNERVAVLEKHQPKEL